MPETVTTPAAVSADLYQEIHQFYARHMYAGDSGDLDGWAAGFTEDAVFVSNGLPEPLEGRDAIDAATRAGHAARADRGAVHRHIVTMLDVRPQDADSVATRSYVLVVESVREAGAKLHVSTVLEDRLVRADGGWRVAGRWVSRDDLPAAPATS
ncbi:nuclear transport factor 2 family protein [Streptomyces sp. NPDC014733]|uniref:nuclear transport factor 2 family protein n=1 Tax=Streptomyces sp. NPDC014733 TaxID=3364885 RepID=UPI0036F627FD